MRYLGMSDIYSMHKIFHFNEKLDSLPQTTEEIRPPVHIRIKPTNVCGHHCWYCAYRNDNLQLGKDMVIKDSIPREKMLEIVDDIADMGVKAVTFSGGGDPFYYHHLVETVKKLAQTKVQFASLTNGARLDGELADVFADAGSWLRISIDGWDGKSYAQQRNVRDDEFSKVINNLQNFAKRRKRCYLGLSIIVDHKNALHLYEMIKIFSDLGADSVKVSPCIVSNDGNETNAYHKKIWSTVEEQVNLAISDFGSPDFEIYFAYHQVANKFDKQYAWCPYIQILPVIGADMNVYACHDKAYNLDNGVLGSIANIRFKDFWFSNKNKFFKINPKIDCQHHCVADEKNKMVLQYLNVEKAHMGFV